MADAERRARLGMPSPPDVALAPVSGGRRVELDFVRGIAILLALGWHFNQVWAVSIPFRAVIWPGKTFGWAGVDLFFVLSGFLIGGLIFEEIRLTGGFAAMRFLVRRAFKIWPILYLFVLIQVVVGRHSWHDFVLQVILHVQNYWKSSFDHLWSLAVEEHFYTVSAIAFAYIARHKDRVRLIPRVLLATCAACLSLRLGATYLGMPAADVQVQTQFRIDSLACGVVLAYVRVFERLMFERIVQMRFACALAAVLGFGILSLFDAHSRFTSTLGYTIAYLASAGLLLLCVGLPKSLTGNPVFRAVAALGVYSYATYIYQFALLRPSLPLVERLGLSGDTALAAALLMRYGGAILVAVVVTRLVERGARQGSCRSSHATFC